jgi:hypothetical protein
MNREAYYSCSCRFRLPGDSICDWCKTQPQPMSTLESQKFLDELVLEVAVELGWRAGLRLSGFADPSQHFESGGGI